MRVKLAARAAVPTTSPNRLHIGGVSGMRVKLARPAAPQKVPPVVPIPDTPEPAAKIELTPEHREMIRAAKVRETLDKIGEASDIFPHMRQDVLAEVGAILVINPETNEVQNLPQAMKVARSILKVRRDAVMTNESAKGF
jgi:hypothetical protein